MSTFHVHPEIHHVDPVVAGDPGYQCPCCGHSIIPVDATDRAGMWCHEYHYEICAEGDDIESPCYFVEFAVLYQDYTWDTEVAELPTYYGHDRCTTDDLVHWASVVLAKRHNHLNVAQYTVYSTNLIQR